MRFKAEKSDRINLNDLLKRVEEKRKALETRFEKTDADYLKKFETSISTGLEAAQKELAAAIESGDAQAQVEANKRIATLAFENAKLEQAKAGREEKGRERKNGRERFRPSAASSGGMAARIVSGLGAGT